MIQIKNKKELDELKIEGRYLRNIINNTKIVLLVDEKYLSYIESSDRYISTKLSKSILITSCKKGNEVHVNLSLNAAIVLFEIMDIIYCDNEISKIFKELQDLLIRITHMEYEEAFDRYIK